MGNLKIFTAGVAGRLVKNAAERFEKKYPGSSCEVSVGGSNAGIDRLRSGEIFDVMILADSENIDEMLMPEYTDGYFIWGGNEMVVMGKDITSENWKEKLLNPDAKIMHMNPYNDPGGYRAVMAMKLADQVEPGLSDKLFNHPNYNGLDKAQYEGGFRPPMTEEEGVYRIVYKTIPASRGEQFAELPPQMNLGSPKHEDLYRTAQFTIGSGETVSGNVIMHAVMIPKNAVNTDDAKEFVKMFLTERFNMFGFTHVQKKVGKWDVEIPNMWDAESKYYSRMTLMEINGTNKQLDCIPLEKDFVVLDCGCGPGRVAIQAAKRVKKVICLDSSTGMLDECKKNCAAAGITNVEFVLADWQETEIGSTIPEVDVVIQSRGGGGSSTFSMLNKAARKYAATIMWAEGAPNLPMSRAKLFVDCYSVEAMEQYPELRPLRFPPKMAAMGLQAPTVVDKDTKLPMGGNGLAKSLKSLGVEVHETTIEEGWDRLFKTKQEAYEWLIELSRHPELVNMEQFKKNVDSFLTEQEDGYYFFLPTQTVITWFKTR